MFRPIFLFSADSLGGALKVLRVVMTVDAIKQLDSHAEKTCRFSFVAASLHQPSRSGVA
jgi:hypothetical protein